MDTFASRPAVPAPPPAYSTINRVTRGKSLRGVVMVCTIGGFIWSLVVGIDYMRAMGRDGLTSRLKTVYLVQGILFFALAGLETIGLYAAWTQKMKAGRIYVFAVILGGAIVVIAETLRMVLHFVFKNDIKSACQTRYANDREDFASSADLTEWCDSDWRNGIWRDAAWLVFGAICSVFMYILSRAYYHQLLDPNFGRTSGGAASDRFRLQQMGGPTNVAVPYGQDPPFVPPYSTSGLPNTGSGYSAEPPSYNSYDAPAYSPPEKGGNPFAKSDSKDGDIAVYREQSGEDLESQVQHLNAGNSSDDTLPGRQREGRV